MTTSNSPVAQITNRAAWQATIDELRVKEKAHTRAGDALAAERRRLPMVEVDPTTKLTGADGSALLTEVFDGRSQLIADRRPIVQGSRIRVGRNDGLGTAPGDHSEERCH